ncbi:hypothetical protein CVD28_01335 [Bacillus sp. M6-12]|uniref:TVP38/TMEM64 family protein n=1 Tax=Bacillus sp. M6-12 TaxID=2054166 RepID=UPI000C77B4BA|nr:VTT domain-containing protein [Bacillus sp. M6-12]PLS19077.1 hypothetical protein CVD28_01335 [Bacillus sp. M6-12]
MKKKKKYIILLIWVLILGLLYINDLLTFDIEQIQGVLEESQPYGMVLFVLLFAIRIFLLLPSLPFMIMGGLLFGGWKGFILSLIGLTISLTFVYFIATVFSESDRVQKIKNKHQKLFPIIERYNQKFLAVGILAPVANTDVVCLLSTFTGISYVRYLITITIVNVPTVLLYSFMGNTYNTSFTGMITVGIFSILNFSVGLYILYKIKKDMKTLKERSK